jgi:hypothetical protein
MGCDAPSAGITIAEFFLTLVNTISKNPGYRARTGRANSHNRYTHMNLTIENILLVGSILLFIRVIAGKTSYRFGVPTLLLFLGIGMLAGSDGIGGIHFDNPQIAQFIGIISLNFILFSGGLDTNWTSVKPILKEVTIDAMGTQKAIANQIIDQQADYVLALKENQPTLLEEVKHALILCRWFSQRKKWMQIMGV